ncbi:MAG: RluA family pseudouridine synthase [Alphaproteobacteria bacterium]|nr:RluA family pseudouridine synthase [Alphaproteobacteria bacterium]
MDDEQPDPPTYRELPVPPAAVGMRLDRFLALRFRDRSRTELARGIRLGQVTDALGKALRASTTMRADDVLHLYLPEIAPGAPPPPFPPIVYEDDRVVAVDKPAGLMAHPSGTRYVYALIGMAKARWPDDRIDLVHRLDMDTSGLNLITKDLEANRWLKARLHDDGSVKAYLAIAKGVPDWDERTIDAPLGPADGPIRIQVAVRDDGLPSRTHATVVARHPTAPLTLVHCRIFTGRTHQIRVHLASVGLPLLGDVLYGLPVDVALGIREQGMTEEALAVTGAPRHALHAAHLSLPHPDGGLLDLHSPLPADLQRWWDHPEELPWNGA